MRKKQTNLTNPYKIEYWINKGFSKEESLIKIEFHKNKTSNRRIEFWINKGFSEEESLQKINEIQSKASKLVKHRISTTQLSYWTNKGFSIEDAILQVKLRQATGKKENFIKRYGENEGINKWKSRQLKWQATLDKNFSKETRKQWSSFTYEDSLKKYGKDKADKILKSKLKHLGLSYSKVSFSLFSSIDNIIKRKVYYGENEYVIKRNKWTYIVDFYDLKTNKVIEFFGTLYHADPRFYNENDVYNPWTKDLAKNIWERDKLRILNLKETVNDILIIWEHDWYTDKENVIQKCINFLENE